MKENIDVGLKDKVAIVAGGGSNGDGIGNGRAASILLAEARAKVLVEDINKKYAKNTVDLIKNNGRKAFAITADLTSSIAMPIEEFLPFRTAILGFSLESIIWSVWITFELLNISSECIKWIILSLFPKKENFKLGYLILDWAAPSITIWGA